MRLSEIKTKIAALLAQLTIDDFYANPVGLVTMSRSTFQKLTKHATEEEIQNWLLAQLPLTNKDTSHAYWKAQKEDLLQKKQQAIHHYDQLVKDLNALKEELKEYEASIYYPRTSEDNVLSNEYLQNYSRLIALEKETVQETEPGETDRLKEAQARNRQITGERREDSQAILEKHREYKSRIKELNATIKVQQSTPYQYNQPLNNLDSWLLHYQDPAYFQADAEGLDYLLAILLGLQLTKRNFTQPAKSTLSPIPLPELNAYILGRLNGKLTMPPNWRQQLEHICSRPIPRLSGRLVQPLTSTEPQLRSKKTPLATTDMAAFLILKKAVQRHEYLVTATKQIFLILTGGFAALIKFREKGPLIARQQTGAIELYHLCLQSDGPYVLHTLYQQSDRTPAAGNSVETPAGYYILTATHVIELTFQSVPLLAGFDAMAKAGSNTSSDGKTAPTEPQFHASDWEE